MKKIISLLLALAMVLSLAACGSSASEPPKGDIKPLEDTEQESNTPQQTEEETQPAEDDNSFSLGAMQGGIYENTYAGFGCKLNENWVYKTAEELQDVTGLTEEMFEGTDLDFSAYNQILDMMADCSDPFASINIQYTALSAQERLAHAMAGEEGLIDGTLQQKDLLISTYAQAGIDVSAMEKVTVNFCGEERFAIHTTASVQDTPYYILQLFYTNIGPYYVTVTLGAFVEDTTPQLAELFYKLG